MPQLFFLTTLPLHLHPLTTPLQTRPPKPPTNPQQPHYQPFKSQQTPSTPPNSNNNSNNNKKPNNQADPFSTLDPTTNPHYIEARICALGHPPRFTSNPASSSLSNASLVALKPISDDKTVQNRVFRMSVTPSQVESIRRGVLFGNGGSGKNEVLGEDVAWKVGGGGLGRPGTHCLFKRVLDGVGGVVSKVAVTHVEGDVFYGRVWIKGGALGLGEEIGFDARPSDAIAMAVRYRASVWLNRGLLREWGVSEERVVGEFGGRSKRGGGSGGGGGVVDYGDRLKSTRSLVGEVRKRPEWLKVARVRARLDLAVRLERFAEAGRLRDELIEVWPVERLEEELKVAVEEERYMDAAKIRDDIYKFRLAMIESQRECRELKGGDEDVGKSSLIEGKSEEDLGIQDNNADSKDCKESSS